MRTIERAILLAVGGGFAVTGLALLASGGIDLPTRRPPVAFRFSGVPLLLLALSPLAAAAVSLGIGSGRLARDGRPTQVLIVVAIVSLGAAFLMAPKA